MSTSEDDCSRDARIDMLQKELEQGLRDLGVELGVTVDDFNDNSFLREATSHRAACEELQQQNRRGGMGKITQTAPSSRCTEVSAGIGIVHAPIGSEQEHR